MKSLILLNNSSKKIPRTEDTEVIDLLQLKDEAFNLKVFKRFFSYSSVTLITYRIDFLKWKFICVLLIRFLSRGSVWMEDDTGLKIKVDAAYLIKLFTNLLSDFIPTKKVVRNVIRDVSSLNSSLKNVKNLKGMNVDGKTIFYLRTDFSFGSVSGGSVGHIAGVVNGLKKTGYNMHFFTTNEIPTVSPEIKQNIILPESRFFDFSEIPQLAFSRYFADKVVEASNDVTLSLIYQRYSMDNFSGVILAQKYRVPFVLEYNGSEVWVAKNWGSPLKYQELAENIEILNLDAADMVVVVSRPLKDELVGRGVKPDKILVNPNGIDPDKYTPAISSAEVRKHYGFENKLVVGFIGTFGPWHGAEILAQAAVKLCDEIEISNLHFLFIGDGGHRLATENIIKEGNASAYCTFTGLVPQEEGAKHLAACDILISPHVPNPDGSPFFGSPTKLFEYMGMGKAIIASDLEQIGEILEHNRTALMVEPGNVGQLAKEILRLEKDNDLRNKLGRNARDEVVSKYTWEKNVENMVDAFN